MLKFLLALLCPLLLLADGGVTYSFSGGRFGDNLLSYLHTKWIAYQHQVPLLYRPFEYSSELMLSSLEKPLLGAEPFESWPPSEFNPSAIYLCPYFPEDLWERNRLYQYTCWEVNWKDPAFRKEALAHIAPNHPVDLILPPSGKISIALHFREGGGFDFSIEQWPVKLPGVDFYVQGLLKVMELTENRPLFCQVFTDARHPYAFIERLQQALPASSPIEFRARRGRNRHNKNVLEDFFSLFHYDILIRPQSNFSIIPSLLHDYAICYYPVNGEQIGKTSIVTETRTEVQQDLLQKILFEYDD